MNNLMNEFLQLFSHSEGKASKSTVITPLVWLITSMLAGLTATNYYDAPDWISIFIACALSIVLACLLFAYIYSLLKNPDLLRTEKYVISKMAIEKSAKGDSDLGLFIDDKKSIAHISIEDRSSDE